MLHTYICDKLKIASLEDIKAIFSKAEISEEEKNTSVFSKGEASNKSQDNENSIINSSISS